MNLPPVPDELLHQAITAWQRHGRNAAQAARDLGISRSGLQHRLKQAERRGFLAAPSVSRDRPDGELRVLVMPDAHDKPGMSKDRFRWFGQHVDEFGPDQVVYIGDFADMFSLCSHAGNDTWTGKFKPSFTADIESMSEALSLSVRRGVEHHKVCGNHEHRLYRYEDLNPEIYGLMQAEYELTLKQHQVELHPFGKHYTIGMTDFVHVPLNIMGRPVGGKTAAVTIGRESIHDTVFGHTHRKGLHLTPKFGGGRVTTVETGCFLPWGFIEEFAKHNTTGWWWGCVELTLLAGRIEGVSFIPMFELERRYR